MASVVCASAANEASGPAVTVKREARSQSAVALALSRDVFMWLVRRGSPGWWEGGQSRLPGGIARSFPSGGPDNARYSRQIFLVAKTNCFLAPISPERCAITGTEHVSADRK